MDKEKDLLSEDSDVDSIDDPEYKPEDCAELSDPGDPDDPDDPDYVSKKAKVSWTKAIPNQPAAKVKYLPNPSRPGTVILDSEETVRRKHKTIRVDENSSGSRTNKPRIIIVDPNTSNRPKPEIIRIKVTEENKRPSSCTGSVPMRTSIRRSSTPSSTASNPPSDSSLSSTSTTSLIYKDLHTLYLEVKGNPDEINSVYPALYSSLEAAVKKIRYYDRMSVEHLQIYYAILAVRSNNLDRLADDQGVKPLTNMGLRFDLFERLSSFLAKSGDLTAAVIQEIGPEKYQEFCGVVDKHRVSKTVFLRENIVANIGLFHRIRNVIVTQYISMAKHVDEAFIEPSMASRLNNQNSKDWLANLKTFLNQPKEQQIQRLESHVYKFDFVNKLVDVLGPQWRHSFILAGYLDAFINEQDSETSMHSEACGVNSRRGSSAMSQTIPGQDGQQHEAETKASEYVVNITDCAPSVGNIEDVCVIDDYDDIITLLDSPKGETTAEVRSSDFPLHSSTVMQAELPIEAEVVKENDTPNCDIFMEQSNQNDGVEISETADCQDAAEGIEVFDNGEEDDIMSEDPLGHTDEAVEMSLPIKSPGAKIFADEKVTEASEKIIRNPFFVDETAESDKDLDDNGTDNVSEDGDKNKDIDEQDDQDRVEQIGQIADDELSDINAFFVDETANEDGDFDDNNSENVSEVNDHDENITEQDEQNEGEEEIVQKTDDEKSKSYTDTAAPQTHTNSSSTNNPPFHASPSVSIVSVIQRHRHKSNPQSPEVSSSCREKVKEAGESRQAQTASPDSTTSQVVDSPKADHAISTSAATRRTPRRQPRLSYADIDEPSEFHMLDELDRTSEVESGSDQSQHLLNVEKQMPGLIKLKEGDNEEEKVRRPTHKHGFLRINPLTQQSSLGHNLLSGESSNIAASGSRKKTGVTFASFDGPKMYQCGELASLKLSIPADIESRVKQSSYFKSKPGQINTTKNNAYFTSRDPKLPEGFLMWERTRSNGKHIDRDFMSPDLMYSFRSRTAVFEYIRLLLSEEEEEPSSDAEDSDHAERTSFPLSSRTPTPSAVVSENTNNQCQSTVTVGQPVLPVVSLSATNTPQVPIILNIQTPAVIPRMNVYDILGQLSPIEPTPPSQPDDSQLVADFDDCTSNLTSSMTLEQFKLLQRILKEPSKAKLRLIAEQQGYILKLDSIILRGAVGQVKDRGTFNWLKNLITLRDNPLLYELNQLELNLLLLTPANFKEFLFEVFSDLPLKFKIYTLGPSMESSCLKLFSSEINLKYQLETLVKIQKAVMDYIDLFLKYNPQEYKAQSGFQAINLKSMTPDERFKQLIKDRFHFSYIKPSHLHPYKIILWAELKARESLLVPMVGKQTFMSMMKKVDPKTRDSEFNINTLNCLLRTIILADSCPDPSWLPLTNPALELEKFEGLMRMFESFGLQSSNLNAIVSRTPANGKLIEQDVWDSLHLYHTQRNVAMDFLINRVKYLFRNVDLLRKPCIPLNDEEMNAITRLTALHLLDHQAIKIAVETDFDYKFIRVLEKRKKKVSSVRKTSLQFCPVCKTKLDNLHHLITHFAETHCYDAMKRIQHTDASNNCSLCGFTAMTTNDLFVHLAVHHEAIKVSFVTWTCKLCSAEYNLRDDVVNHFKLKHADDSAKDTLINKTESRSLPCQVDGCSTTGTYQYIKAHAFEHLSEADKVSILKSPNFKDSAKCLYCNIVFAPGLSDYKIKHYFLNHNLITVFLQPFTPFTVEITPRPPVLAVPMVVVLKPGNEQSTDVILIDESSPVSQENSDTQAELLLDSDDEMEAQADSGLPKKKDSFWVESYKTFCKKENEPARNANYWQSSWKMLEKYLEKITQTADNILKIDAIIEELEAIAPSPLELLPTVRQHLLLKEYYVKCNEMPQTSIFNMAPMQIVIFLSQSMVRYKNEDLVWLMKRISRFHELVDDKPVGLHKRILDFFSAIDLTLDNSYFRTMTDEVKKNKDAIQCKICSKCFKTNMALKVHSEKRHNLSDGQVPCRANPVSPDSKDSSKSSTMPPEPSKSPGKTSRKSSSKNSNINAMEDNYLGYYECPTPNCDKYYNNRKSLRNHWAKTEMCKDNISKEGAATASAASSPETKRSSSMSESSAVNNPKSPDENSDDHAKSFGGVEVKRFLEELRVTLKINNAQIAEMFQNDTGVEITRRYVSKVANENTQGGKAGLFKKWIAEKAEQVIGAGKSDICLDNAGKEKTEMDAKIVGSSSPTVGKEIAKKIPDRHKESELGNEQFEEAVVVETETEKLKRIAKRLKDYRTRHNISQVAVVEQINEAFPTREPFSKWKLHLLEQEKATVVRYLATIEEWLNNVDCSHDNPTATAQSTSISLGACSQAQVDRSTAPSMVPLLPDIAYSPRYGTTVRTQWKQLVKQGMLECEPFSGPIICKLPSCTVSLKDPVETFRHIKTKHLNNPVSANDGKVTEVNEATNSKRKLPPTLANVSLKRVKLEPEEIVPRGSNNVTKVGQESETVPNSPSSGRLAKKRSKDKSGTQDVEIDAAAKERKGDTSQSPSSLSALNPSSSRRDFRKTKGTSDTSTSVTALLSKWRSTPTKSTLLEKWRSWDPDLLTSDYFLCTPTAISRPTETTDDDAFQPDASMPAGWKTKETQASCANRSPHKYYLSPDTGIQFRSLLSVVKYMELKGTYTQKDFDLVRKKKDEAYSKGQ